MKRLMFFMWLKAWWHHHLQGKNCGLAYHLVKFGCCGTYRGSNKSTWPSGSDVNITYVKGKVGACWLHPSWFICFLLIKVEIKPWALLTWTIGSDAIITCKTRLVNADLLSYQVCYRAYESGEIPTIFMPVTWSWGGVAIVTSKVRSSYTSLLFR